MGHDILEASIQWITLRDDRLTGEVALRSLVMLIAICLFSYIAVASFSFVRRCMAGASIRDLLANGCYEWIPGRGFHFVITGCLWIGRLGSGLAIIAAGLRALAQFDEDKTPEWTSAIIILAGTILAFTLARWLYHFHSETFIRVTRVKPPEVQVSVKSIQALRDVGDTSRIGTEKFPNDASPFFGVGLLARRLLRFLNSGWL
ncbi:MAG: hypothetical protein DVB23_001455 [Verrucomicrobia bacterium]|nr:MAG: hypothetical protein DVB23_001455 [Verrucomicrobiota bacterium]